MIYSWRDGFHVPVPASDVGPQINQLLRKHGTGGLKPSHLVREAALRTKSPLHRCFEWNNLKAAHRFRLIQAGTILRALVVVRDGRPSSTPQRLAVSVRRAPAKSPVYLDTVVVMKDRVLRQQFIEQAQSDLAAWRRRYGALRELHDLFVAVEHQLELLSA